LLIIANFNLTNAEETFAISMDACFDWNSHLYLIRWQNFTDRKLLLENKFAYCALSVITEAIAYANQLALESNQAKNSIESKLGIQL